MTEMVRDAFMQADGAIKVQLGDTISAYCAKIYGKPPASTKSHWGEFGRQRYGTLAPIKDPNRIFAGETIYHLPTAQGKKAAVSKDSKPAPTPPPTTGPLPAAQVTNIWWGIGVDVQYTLGVIGQQLMVFSLRSYDDPQRVALLLVDNIKAGLSVDLTTGGYLVLATGLHRPAELHNQNSSEKLDWDWTLALGLKWGDFIKNGKKSVKATKSLAPVVREGTRMVRRKVPQDVLERVAKIIKESQKSKKQKVIEYLTKIVTPTPGEAVGLVKGLKKAIDEALDIDFESAYPRVHFIPIVGGGVGLGVTWNFGEILVLSGA